MTENEAIERMKYRIETATDIAGKGVDGKAYEDMEMAITALEEIQQYCSIGTVEECLEAVERHGKKKYKIIKPCKSVNYYQCPVCDGLLHINENFCGNCGQAISWEESEGEDV